MGFAPCHGRAFPPPSSDITRPWTTLRVAPPRAAKATATGRPWRGLTHGGFWEWEMLRPQNGPCGECAEGSDRSGVHLLRLLRPIRLLRPTAAGHGWMATRNRVPLDVPLSLGGHIRPPGAPSIQTSGSGSSAAATDAGEASAKIAVAFGLLYCFFQPLCREDSGRMRVKPGVELTLPALPDDVWRK